MGHPVEVMRGAKENMARNGNAAGRPDFLKLPLEEMESIAARFEQRIHDAQKKAPPSKEWVRKALRRQGAARCPIRLKRLSLDVVVKYGDALADLFCEYPDDVVCVAPYDITIGYQEPYKADRVNPVRAMMTEAQWTDEWGTRWGHAYGGVGATPVDHPIKDWSQLDDYLANRVPDAHAPGRLSDAKRVVDMHRESKYCVGLIQLTLFERMHALRGMEPLFMDFYTNEREVNRLGEVLTNYMVQLIGYWARLGVDALLFTDDWGTQQSMMIGVDMWLRFFEKPYRRIFGEVHKHGMDVIFHSCGNVTDIVPHLIDVGVDVVDPVQPGAMNPQVVARRFGGKVGFSGGIDDQLLAVYTPQRLRDEVRRTIDTLGKPFGNAYLAGPANAVTPEIPIENLRALFEACREQ
jgi:uroporphyrinogen decarboxylase